MRKINTMNVPLFRQKKNTCGITALRMVLAYWGTRTSDMMILEKIGGLKNYGVQTTKLADVASSLGFHTQTFSYNKKMAKNKAEIRKPHLTDIVSYLKKKIPVIVNVRSALLYNEHPTSVGHFIVITGYKNKALSYNDPYDGKKHTIDEEDFLFAWFPNALASSAYLVALWPNQ